METTKTVSSTRTIETKTNPNGSVTTTEVVTTVTTDFKGVTEAVPDGAFKNTENVLPDAFSGFDKAFEGVEKAFEGVNHVFQGFDKMFGTGFHQTMKTNRSFYSSIRERFKK